VSAADRAHDLLGRLVHASAFERFLISTSALLLSVFIGALIILGAGRMTDCASAAYTIAVPGKFVTQFVGGSAVFSMGFCYDPFAVYDLLFLGALGDVLSNPLNGQFATTLAETTILMFTGVAVAVAFRADIFNIGVQGQLVVGALTTGVVLAFVAPALAGLGLLATVVLLPLGLLLGAVAGGAYAAIPGALKAYADANEVITTIMLNFVATSIALFLVSREKFFKDPASFANQTVPLPDVALFPKFLFRPRDDVSLLAFAFAVVVLVGIWYLLQHTPFGYDLRTSGLQPDAAEYGGVDADRTIVSSMTLSGALAGIGGAVYVLMVLGNFQTGVPPPPPTRRQQPARRRLRRAPVRRPEERLHRRAGRLGRPADARRRAPRAHHPVRRYAGVLPDDRPEVRLVRPAERAGRRRRHRRWER